MSTKANECLATPRSYIKHIKLPMGCLSSRSSSTVASEMIDTKKQRGIDNKTINGINKKLIENGQSSTINSRRGTINKKQSSFDNNNNKRIKSNQMDRKSEGKEAEENDGVEQEGGNNRKLNAETELDRQDNDIMSIIMDSKIDEKNNSKNEETDYEKDNDENDRRIALINNNNNNRKNYNNSLEREQSTSKSDTDNSVLLKKENDSSDEETNDLIRQYVAVDYEITQLEARQTLRIYHEKIEQLEQLEGELDMISAEAEVVAARSEQQLQTDSNSQQMLDRNIINNNNNLQSSNSINNENSNSNNNNNNNYNTESNSMLSGATGSMSLGDKQQQQQQQQQRIGKHSINKQLNDSSNNNNNNNSNSIPYSTVEEVFNRKIILEKERDKLKKEVELVIIECDKLQQRYRRRDEILDKLFEGGAGNGLENHLEQQLNWLLEQKNYVDQVFYAWKRAETLTSQTCEQFATSLELLKRFPKIEDQEQREELGKSIGDLLIKSRQDMEQAQKYNPNVDAPFFTENETERFDKIIQTISSNSISPTEYSQILTVIQFAYKRAVSIRLWLEQILQTTIARDSFELAEEYKWIAIQLRKERINLIKSRLQEEPYSSMVKSVLDEIVKQQTKAIVDRRQQQQNQQQQHQQQQQQQQQQDANNRDSGVETNDVDIEEEIYRLLELNKARLEKIDKKEEQTTTTSSVNNNSNINNIQKQLAGIPSAAISSGVNSARTNTTLSSTPSKLRIELDEAARQNLLKQVDEIHNKHKSRIDKLKYRNKARANDSIINKLAASNK